MITGDNKIGDFQCITFKSEAVSWLEGTLSIVIGDFSVSERSELVADKKFASVFMFSLK